MCGGQLGPDCDIKPSMEKTADRRSIPTGWKLTLLLPLAAAVVLQLISHKQTNLHEGIKLSILGNVLLSISMIAYSVYLVRKSKAWWAIAMLIFTSAGLGFGLHVLLRSL